MQMGATIIVVDAIWPQYRYPNGDPNYAKSADLVKPDYRFEDLKSICDRNGWHYLKMDEFAFNGAQYNYALDYIERQAIPCEYIYFIDSDECLDPVYMDVWISHIEQCKGHNLSQLRFNKTLEIVPGWKGLEVDGRVGGSYGIVWGEALRVKREEFFDGNFHFKSPVAFGVTEVPLYHLHHFRKNAARRINDGVFDTGGKAYRIADAPDMPNTDYVLRLKGKYGDGFQVDSQSVGSYMGTVIFDANK